MIKKLLFLICLLFPNIVNAAAVTLLTSTFNTTAGTHTATGTPAVNDLIVIICANTGIVTTPTVSDDNSSGTYSLIVTGIKVAATDSQFIFIRDSLIGSSVSTIFSCTGASSTGGGLTVLKVTSMTRAGVSAALQSKNQDAQAASSTPAPVFAATPQSANPIIGAVHSATNSTTTVVQRTGYTELFDNGYALPATGLEVMSLDSGETSATITWGGTSTTIYSDVVVELDTTSPPVTGVGYFGQVGVF